MPSFLAFLGVAALVIATPGPDTALTIRNTLLGGRRAGVATAAGVVTGQVAWTLAASAGIAAVLVASETAFHAVRLVGAAYLLVLGVQALVTAFAKQTPRGTAVARRPARSLRPALAYRQGLLSNLGNPKMAVFFSSLLPQFALGGEPAFLTLFPLGLVFAALTLAWLSAYAVVVAKAGDVFRRPAIRRALDALVGAVLVALGLRVATERQTG